MKQRETWIGQCELCGESDTTLVENKQLPEWTEGVACLSCESSMLDDIAQRQRIDHQIRLDRFDDAASDAIFNGDFE